MGEVDINGIHLKWIIGTHGNWKNQKPVNLAHLSRKWAKWAELAVPFSWQLQNDPHDFISFSIAMGADYSFELIATVHLVPQFVMHIK